VPTAETRIATDRAARYLEQLCRHAAAMDRLGGHPRGPHAGGEEHPDVTVDARWSGTRGVIAFAPYGSCTLEAGESELVVRVEAADEDALARIRRIVAADLDRFGRRDGLAVSWG
jgi:hypothetical protein